MSDKPAEQADHARGAGLREALELIRRTPTMPFPDPGAHSWRAFAEAVHRAYVRIQQVAEAALREPGADTGTTPPPSTAEFEPLLRGELKHGRSCPAVGAPMDEGNCDCGLKWRIRLQTEMTLRNAWEKRAYEAEAALAAATQRAPVEQGPLKLNYVPRWNSQIIAAEVLSEMRGLDVVTCQNEVALHDAIAKVVKRATEAAAPDHAREGALTKGGAALLREAKWWYKEFVWPWRADDEDSDDRARKRLAALGGWKGRWGVSDWPRLTKPQRLMLLDMERNHGVIQHTPRQRQTAYALAWHGMVKTFGPFSGIELTQRGRDYLRFGLKRGQK